MKTNDRRNIIACYFQVTDVNRLYLYTSVTQLLFFDSFEFIHCRQQNLMQSCA